MPNNRKKVGIVYKKLSELKPYARNPRRNDAAVPALEESIKWSLSPRELKIIETLEGADNGHNEKTNRKKE